MEDIKIGGTGWTEKLGGVTFLSCAGNGGWSAVAGRREGAGVKQVCGLWIVIANTGPTRFFLPKWKKWLAPGRALCGDSLPSIFPFHVWRVIGRAGSIILPDWQKQLCLGFKNYLGSNQIFFGLELPDKPHPISGFQEMFKTSFKPLQNLYWSGEGPSGRKKD